ncbi:hypothetical protein [Shewanella sp. AC91-MNA-CIBAN-0169]|uniref:hypothetical protein n=1 Tax=Shewanella sp. AC91-MNA-CIBAN-0169 TaxID=3140466 RepID=UPI00332D1274
MQSVSDASKIQLDAHSIQKIGNWCELNITPMTTKVAEDESENYNHLSKNFNSPLRGDQIAMYAFDKPDNKVIANMHIKYVQQNYSWKMDDLKEADTYIKRQFQEKRKRHPAIGEDDLCSGIVILAT